MMTFAPAWSSVRDVLVLTCRHLIRAEAGKQRDHAAVSGGGDGLAQGSVGADDCAVFGHRGNTGGFVDHDGAGSIVEGHAGSQVLISGLLGERATRNDNVKILVDGDRSVNRTTVHLDGAFAFRIRSQVEIALKSGLVASHLEVAVVRVDVSARGENVEPVVLPRVRTAVDVSHAGAVRSGEKTAVPVVIALFE